MFYAELKEKPEGIFKRLTGVRPATFLDMCDALEKHLPSGGRVPKLCLEDRLLLTLMYWREYRTEAHIAQTYGVSESTICRTIHAVEAALMCSGAFRLPGKKSLSQSDVYYQVVVVDATECPVERPKKSNGETTAARKSVTPRRLR
jgi:Helix-turn-helix of DDE superfamily endonuclease